MHPNLPNRQLVMIKFRSFSGYKNKWNILKVNQWHPVYLKLSFSHTDWRVAGISLILIVCSKALCDSDLMGIQTDLWNRSCLPPWVIFSLAGCPFSLQGISGSRLQYLAALIRVCMKFPAESLRNILLSITERPWFYWQYNSWLIFSS